MFQYLNNYQLYVGIIYTYIRLLKQKPIQKVAALMLAFSTILYTHVDVHIRQLRVRTFDTSVGKQLSFDLSYNSCKVHKKLRQGVYI